MGSNHAVKRKRCGNKKMNLELSIRKHQLICSMEGKFLLHRNWTPSIHQGKIPTPQGHKGQSTRNHHHSMKMSILLSRKEC